MAEQRTTIMMDKVLYERVLTHLQDTEESLTSFYNRAILNQLEKEGDFEIRDLIESNKGE